MVELLKKILNHKLDRTSLIKEFQEAVWNNDSPNAILADIAYDLDFYEPNPELRKGNPSFYGDERLESEIRLAIKKLNNEF